MQISLEEAYAIACQKIGEGQIRETVLNKTLQEKDMTIGELQQQIAIAKEAGFVIEEAIEIVEGADADADRDIQQGVSNNGKLDHEPPQT